MKTKILSPLRRDGYKAGMIMMLIALSTMLLTTACSSEDDLVNNTANTENTINKGYALPVTVSATRGGDATRATFDGSELNFSTGDKLFVQGNHENAGLFAGILDYVPSTGKFSGTIYTKNSYEGTAVALFEGGNVSARLLPAGYETPGYLSINNSGTFNASISCDASKAFATTKAIAVEQFSYETSITYSSGFALSPWNAILNFTITGLAASTEVTASFTDDSSHVISGNVTTDGSGNATFAIGVDGDTNLQNCSLTVGGNAITLVTSSKPLAAGKIYNITRAVTEQEVAGSYFTANSSGLKVVFSKGNLQATYNGSTWTWAFAEHQWDYIGNAEGNTKVSASTPFVSGYSGTSTTVDLFGWVGASSNFTGVAQYGITSSTTLNSEDGYGNVPDESMKAEWNSTNLTITNGGTYSWRTLTGGEGGEWEWIIGPPYDSANPGTNCRASGATVNTVNGIIYNARYTFATINTGDTEVNGIILFPDGCKINSSSATSWGPFNTDSNWLTKCTTAQWTHLEELGCVFLPAAGYRAGAGVNDAGSYGFYWSSSPDSSDPDNAHNVYFGSEAVVAPGDFYDRYYGFSVRLVREVPSN